MNPLFEEDLKPARIAALRFVAVIAAVVMLPLIILSAMSPPPISMARMERIFQNDKEILEPIVNSFQESGYALIAINTDRKSGFIYAATTHGQIGGDVPIDPEISSKIDTLFDKKRYTGITKRDNTIYFQRWAVMENERGIAYTSDGSIPDIEYLTKYAPLSEEHWFYYEADYNQYKRHIGNE